MKQISLPTIAAVVLGALIGGYVTHAYLDYRVEQMSMHPIADPFDTEFHVHADFRIYVEDEQIDLSADEFMTTGTHKVSEHVHLHDGNGEVEHIHAEDVTFAGFLQTVNITLTDSCLTVFDGEALCSNEGNEVLLYVNEELYTQPLSQYEPVDDDRIMLYYGNPQNENIADYVENIPNDSCYYSGTCPERGIAPPESCGLTCEL